MTRIQFRSSIHDGYVLCSDGDYLRAIRRSLIRRTKGATDCRLHTIGVQGRTHHYRATLTARGGAVLAETTVFTEF